MNGNSKCALHTHSPYTPQLNGRQIALKFEVKYSKWIEFNYNDKLWGFKWWNVDFFKFILCLYPLLFSAFFFVRNGECGISNNASVCTLFSSSTFADCMFAFIQFYNSLPIIKHSIPYINGCCPFFCLYCIQHFDLEFVRLMAIIFYQIDHCIEWI